MKKIGLILLFCVCVTLCVSLNDFSATGMPAFGQNSRVLNMSESKIDAGFVRGNNRFSLQMLSLLDDENGNTVLSPFSIYVAFSMAYIGSRNDTKQELQELFGFSTSFTEQNSNYKQVKQELTKLASSGKVELSIANSIFCEQSKQALIREEYRKSLQTDYNAELMYFNLREKAKSVRDVNKWVASKTNNRIMDLIAERNLTPSTIMLLLNAAYFKADWANKFDKKASRAEYFYFDPARPTDKKRVDMMKHNAGFGYTSSNNHQILEMPYNNHDLSMVFILPQDNTKTDFSSIMESFDMWMREIRYQQVIVTIPSFEIDYETKKMREKLYSLGLHHSFDRNSADFFGMVNMSKEARDQIWIEDVLHKAYIKVNEEGSEAAAATVILFGAAPGSVPQRKVIPVFKADRPFYYLIRHRPSGLILFAGKLMQPPDATLSDMEKVLIIGDTMFAQEIPDEAGEGIESLPVTDSSVLPTVAFKPTTMKRDHVRDYILLMATPHIKQIINDKLVIPEFSNDRSYISIQSVFTDSEGSIRACKVLLYNIKPSQELEDRLIKAFLGIKPRNIDKSAQVQLLNATFKMDSVSRDGF